MTQMTLNVFHSSGISSAGAVTSGVARIKEILSIKKKPKTP